MDIYMGENLYFDERQGRSSLVCFKPGLSPSPIFIYFNESPLKMMKNAFHFMLKAVLVIEIFTFLS